MLAETFCTGGQASANYVVWRACDILPAARTILMQGPAKHLFGDIIADRIPRRTARQLYALHREAEQKLSAMLQQRVPMADARDT
eukprot:5467942-Alexandrium_andersonii.AAC.1